MMKKSVMNEATRRPGHTGSSGGSSSPTGDLASDPNRRFRGGRGHRKRREGSLTGKFGYRDELESLDRPQTDPVAPWWRFEGRSVTTSNPAYNAPKSV